MEGVAFILIGGALFSQSWNVMGLYADGRTSGLFTAALAVMALLIIPMAPMLFIGGSTDANPLAEITILQMVVIAWVVYGIGVGAQGLWDFDERAIGFAAAIVTGISITALFYYAFTLVDPYGNSVMLAMSAGGLILSIIGGLVFFYLAFPFLVLRLVTGWFMLVGSVALMAIGIAVITTWVVPS
jgi:hypothetical protein